MHAGRRAAADGPRTAGSLLALLVVALATAAQVGRSSAAPEGDLCRPLSLPTCVEKTGREERCSTNECCCRRQVHACFELRDAAQNALYVRDNFPGGRRGGGVAGRAPSPAETDALCRFPRAFFVCITQLARVCRSDIDYHSLVRGTERQMRRLSCPTRGPVFNCSAAPPPRPRAAVCTYPAPSGPARPHAYCALFGDPHLRTFDGREQTCRALGAWPLVDNEFITVQVTNQQVAALHGNRVTAISKVTVVVKTAGHCAGPAFVTYQASSEWLPLAFDNGRTHFGAKRSVSLTEVRANRHVELRLRHAATTVVVRRTAAGQLSVAVRVPAPLAAPPTTPGVTLCSHGCPPSEVVSRGEWDDAATASAVETCRAAGVVDFHFDSCVFDVVVTGDVAYSETAALALADTLRLAPHAAARRNRTTLAAAHSPAGGSTGLAPAAALLPLAVVAWHAAWT